jgi:hypothetical protein
MSLWVPPDVAAKLVEERREFQADVNRQIDSAQLDRWDRELQRVDEHLRLVLAKPNAWGTPLKPGFWHIVRDNPGAPPSIMPIETADGEYLEPGPHMFDMLARGDMWDPRFMQQIRAAERRAAAAADRERASQRQERQEHLRELVDASTRTQVSMNRDTPWAQNHAGQRRRGSKAA